MVVSFFLYLFLKLSINTQLQFQGQQEHERGVFILELQIGKTYVMKEAETSSDGNITYLKKGAKVRLDVIGAFSVFVQELSEDALDDALWATSADKLVTEEEYAAMQEADIDVEPEPIQLKRGAIYVMKRPEVSGAGRTVYLKKGARVRVESFGTRSALVQDLSDDMIDDGVWMTSVDALMPLEDALIVGDTYYMGEAEKNSRGDVTFLKKGAIVRLKLLKKDRVVVQDLSEAKRGDGIWYTDPVKLIPIDKPEGSAADTHEEIEAAVAEKNKCVEPIVPLEDMVVLNNKHYISDHQPIETMQSNMTHAEMIGFLKGNIIKYACRCGKKDEPLKEAEKIKQYAEWLCIVLSGGTIDPRS